MEIDENQESSELFLFLNVDHSLTFLTNLEILKIVSIVKTALSIIVTPCYSSEVFP